MLLKNVVDFLTKTYTIQHEKLGEPNLTEQDLNDLDSEIVSIESVCRSFRSVIQNKRGQRVFAQSKPTVSSVKLIADEVK